MRFIHISDLHLGKQLSNHYFTTQQEEVLFDLLKYMEKEDIHHLIIAGDVYDRFVPINDAVDLFDRFINQAVLKQKIQVYVIRGNHDSIERLSFASALLKQSGLHIAADLKKDIDVIEIEDEYGPVHIHLLPFFKPGQARMLYNDENIKTFNDGMKVVMQHHRVDPSVRHILVTHQFVKGMNDVVQSDSENILSVGGSEECDVHLFDDFDYVALGHLHAPQKISREEVVYSGSPLRYSFDEVKQHKHFLDVEMKEKGNITIKKVPFSPTLTLEKYRGLLADFLDINKTPVKKFEDYLHFELEDAIIQPNAMDRLRQLYPHALSLSYVALFSHNSSHQAMKLQEMEKMTDLDLYKKFFTFTVGKELSEQQCTIVSSLFDKVGE